MSKSLEDVLNNMIVEKPYPSQIQKIFEMSGLLRLIPVEQKDKKEVQYD